jgi:hypothetical protein
MAATRAVQTSRNISFLCEAQLAWVGLVRLVCFYKHTTVVRRAVQPSLPGTA